MNDTDHLLLELTKRIDALENRTGPLAESGIDLREAGKSPGKRSAGDLAFECLASDLLELFSFSSQDRFEDTLAVGLEKIGQTMDVDFITIHMLSRNTGEFTGTYQWIRPDLTIEIMHQGIQVRNGFPWLEQMMGAAKVITIDRLDDLPPEARNELLECRAKKIQSFAAVPFHVDDIISGYLFVNTITRQRKWGGQIQGRLGLLGRIIGNLLARKTGMDDLNKQLDFQKMHAGLSFSFLDAPLDKISGAVKNGLSEISKYIGADISILLLLDKKKETLKIIHVHDPGGLLPCDKDTGELIVSRVPWFLRQVRDRKIVKADNPDELPNTAAADREQLQALGVASCLSVPLIVKPDILGTLFTGRITPGQKWSDQEINHWGMAANLIGNALSRKRVVRDLLESRERYKSLIENLNVGVFRSQARPGGKIIEANSALVKLMGVKNRKELLSCALTKFYENPEDRQINQEQLLEEGQIKNNRNKFRRLDGAVFTGLVSAVLIKNESGVPVYYDGIVEDISKKVKAEEGLNEAALEIFRLKDQLEKENTVLRQEIRIVEHHDRIVGESRNIRKVLRKIEQVAETDSVVMIFGETGTGKELVARAIHDLSSRKNRAIINVNCAALPATLIESELFGREKGAYTGALTSQEGRFQAADRSTLFLDEVSELPLELQAKLLRVLEDGRFERLGSTETIKVDVRVIAATNRDLSEAVKEGRFRQDLFYRLNVFPVSLPPLRGRADDIPLLVWHFIKRYSREMGKRVEQISHQDMENLQQYDWPGNIRELKNVVEKSMIQSNGPVIKLKVESDPKKSANGFLTMDELQLKHIREALGRTRNVVSGEKGAARLLGMNPKTLWSRMKKLGITPGEFR